MRKGEALRLSTGISKKPCILFLCKKKKEALFKLDLNKLYHVYFFLMQVHSD